MNVLNRLFKQASGQDFSGLYDDAKTEQAHLHHELPYRTFDTISNVFHNTGSIGFGLSLSVLSGANDELIRDLNKVVSDLPQGDKWDYQLSLFGHNRVADYLAANEEVMARRGGICARLAKQEREYAEFAATEGFFHNQPHHFDLRDYHAFFFVSTTKVDDEETLTHLRYTVETAFTQLGIYSERMTPESLQSFVGDVLNFDAKQTHVKGKQYNPYAPLNQQMLAPDGEYLINRRHIDTRHTNEQGFERQSRIVSLGLTRMPGDFRLYMMPECFSSIRDVAKHLRCPHLLTLNFRQEVTGQVEQSNNSKIADLTKTLKSPMAMFSPTAGDELKERQQLQRGLADRDYTLSTMAMTLTLFTTPEQQLIDTTAATNTFASTGLTLTPLIMIQSQALLATLPFMMTDGFWNDAVRAGRMHPLKSSNLVNFFPVVLDAKRFTNGLMLPTLRGQITFFDPFNCGTDNKNIALTGGSGAGKSFLVEQLAKMVYAKGGKVWILDKGAGYKKLTLMLEGTYLDHTRIFLNPFTHLGTLVEQASKKGMHKDDEGNTVDPMKEVLSNITALFATIASPYEALSGLQNAVLGDAIMDAWETHGTDTLVDHVQHALFEHAKQHNNDQRIRDIGIQLNKYCTDGIYGETFNKPSMLDPNIDITTLELDGFSDEVLRPVIFALIVSINQQMYLSGDRSREKMCIIEEAWSLMSGTNAQAQSFINEGYRTARKFGGSFCTVTQGIEDFFSNAEARACYNNSDIHITLRQGEGFETFVKENPKTFTEYEQRVIKNFPRANKAGYSCARIKAGSQVSYHRVFSDPFSRACLSTEPHEFTYCEDLMNQGMALMPAIEATAQHYYGDDIAKFEQAMRRKQEVV